MLCVLQFSSCLPVWAAWSSPVWLPWRRWPSCSLDLAAGTERVRKPTAPPALSHSLCHPPPWCSSQPGPTMSEGTAPATYRNTCYSRCSNEIWDDIVTVNEEEEPICLQPRLTMMSLQMIIWSTLSWSPHSKWSFIMNCLCSSLFEFSSSGMQSKNKLASKQMLTHTFTYSFNGMSL